MTGRTSDGQDLQSSTEAVTQASNRLDQRASVQQLSEQERDQVREALRLLTATNKRLCQQLDQLAQRCGSGPRAEPAESQIALDQAAAAAEDLGDCAKVAAQALADEQAEAGPNRTG